MKVFHMGHTNNQTVLIYAPLVLKLENEKTFENNHFDE